MLLLLSYYPCHMDMPGFCEFIIGALYLYCFLTLEHILAAWPYTTAALQIIVSEPAEHLENYVLMCKDVTETGRGQVPHSSDRRGDYKF